MIIAAAFIALFFLGVHGFMGRARGEASFPAVCAGVILMYVAVRAVAFAAFGFRMSLAFIAVAAACCITYSLARVGLSTRCLAGLAGVAFIFCISFRHGLAGSGLAEAALSMALPGICAGLFCARASTVAFQRTVITLGVALGAVVLVDGALVQGRLVAVGENPIWIARVLGLAAVAYIASRRRLGFGWLLLLPAGFLMYATGSRGPMWAVLVAVIFLYRHRMPSRLRMPAYLLAAMAIVVGLTSVGASRISALGIERESSATTRIELWRAAYSEWLTSPIFGRGTPSDLAGAGAYPHNFIIELLAQGGLIATTIFVVIVLAALRRAWFRSEVLAALLIAALVMCLFSGSLWVNVELWILVGWSFMLSLGGDVASRGQDERDSLSKRDDHAPVAR